MGGPWPWTAYARRTSSGLVQKPTRCAGRVLVATMEPMPRERLRLAAAVRGGGPVSAEGQAALAPTACRTALRVTRHDGRRLPPQLGSGADVAAPSRP